MKFSLKLKKVLAVMLTAVMALGLLQAVPGGAFAVKAKAATVGDQTWNLRETTASEAVQFQKTTGEFKGLLVDATTGKLNIRENNSAQFNATTVIKVPVDGNCKLTIENTGEFTYKINGEEVTGKTMEYNYEGDAGYIEVVSTANNSYINSIKTEHVAEPTLDTSKIDVWDFGAEDLGDSYYNNITVDVINSWFPGVAAGTTGKDLAAGFTVQDGKGVDALKFVTNKTNNRIRTITSGVTRKDEKSLIASDGEKKLDTVFKGYLYSNNASATPQSVDSASTNISQIEVYLYAGDVFTAWLGSNGTEAKYSLVDADGVEVGNFTFSAKISGTAEEAKFYAAKEGWYTLYCTNEKLVLARAYREHTPKVTVSGTVTAPSDIPDGYSLVFTNKSSGAVKKASVSNGSYSVSLNGKYEYDVTLADANGYVVETGSSVKLDTADVTADVKIKAVDLITVTGKISGMPSDQLAKLNLNFTADAIYVPEITVNTETGAFTLKVESGIEYAVTADNVNDYELKTTSVKFTEAKSDAAITFEKKPTYKASVTFTGLTGVDTSNVKVTFTNISETSYTYTYGINDDMQLRNGQYKVSVSGLGANALVQKVTPDVKINDGPGTTVVGFNKIDDWDISQLAGSNAIETIGESKYFAGLKLDGNISLNKATYLLTNAGSTVTIPNVKAGDKITLNYCYSASFTVEGTDIAVDEKSGSTSKIDSQSFTAAKDGDVVITTNAGANASQTYFTSIIVNAAADMVAYKSTVTVGADKDYTTINAALAAIRNMDRDSATQNVTIMIDPGNYEEMLVLDTPNVTLKNASEYANTELKNSGVDIDDNAVRVTWYYGHGYTYYSMGSDSKYDAELLAANQANGYASYENTGSGTTNGSYWNATVVVTADNISADGIIFENSFNQYVSEAAAKDTIVSQSSAKNGTVKRDDLKTVGDTTVQQKAYVERAAALAIYNNVSQTYFNNCKFIGRQDTLYGGTGATAVFNDCSVYGGTDYIFGAMTAVFNRCDLVFNTSDDSNDVGYITAPQQSSGRGYLMYECTVTSTVPGVDTASEYTSKPGYFGRPWQANTGEAVFYNTTVEAADEHWATLGESLISEAGWLSSLGGESKLCGEYGTKEEADVDNTSKRISWASVFTEAKLADGTEISAKSWLGDWSAVLTSATNTTAFDANLATAKAEAAKTDVYTAESLAELNKVIDKAAAVDTKSVKTRQSDVNVLAAELESATGALEAKPVETPSTTQTSTTTDSDNVKVADSASSVVSGIELSSDVTFADGVKASEVQITFKAATEAQENAIKAAVDTSKAAKLQVIDLDLAKADGTVVKLASGKIAVTIAKDTDTAYSEIKVYHLLDDGKVEELPVAVGDSTITFETTSFSPFAIEYVAAEAQVTSPDTGDTANAAVYILLAMLAAAFIAFSSKKRRVLGK
jgi:pectin methylesterase-like acyl-CoA thioesterase